jgi:hypothetical protein
MGLTRLQLGYPSARPGFITARQALIADPVIGYQALARQTVQVAHVGSVRHLSTAERAGPSVIGVFRHGDSPLPYRSKLRTIHSNCQ